MLTNDFLNKWVKIIVPTELGPNKSLEAGFPLLGVYLSDDDSMSSMYTTYKKQEIGEDSRAYGVLIPMGDIRKAALGDAGKLKGRFIIQINKDQSEANGIFSLAHEVGHLVGIINNTLEHAIDEDAFADGYAFKRVKEVVEDQSLQMLIYLKGSSGNSF